MNDLTALARLSDKYILLCPLLSSLGKLINLKIFWISDFYWKRIFFSKLPDIIFSSFSCFGLQLLAQFERNNNVVFGMENQDGAFYCRQPSANYQILIISTYNLNIQYQKYMVTQKYKRLEIKKWFFQWNPTVWLGLLVLHQVNNVQPYSISSGFLFPIKLIFPIRNNNNNKIHQHLTLIFFIWKSLTFRIRREDLISPTAEEYQLSMTTFEQN